MISNTDHASPSTRRSLHGVRGALPSHLAPLVLDCSRSTLSFGKPIPIRHIVRISRTRPPHAVRHHVSSVSRCLFRVFVDCHTAESIDRSIPDEVLHLTAAAIQYHVPQHGRHDVGKCSGGHEYLQPSLSEQLRVDDDPLNADGQGKGQYSLTQERSAEAP